MAPDMQLSKRQPWRAGSHVCFVVAALAPSGCAPVHDVSWVPGKSASTPASGPFTYKEHLVFIRASVNGAHEIWTLFDTGANTCAIDSDVAQSLDLKPAKEVTIHGSAGTTNALMHTLDNVQVFGVNVRHLETTAYELKITAPDGHRAGMILGYPFLKHFAVDIDYAQRRFALVAKTARSVGSIPFRLDDGIPCIRATLPSGVDVELRVDTGASLFDTRDVYLNLTASQYDRLKAQGLQQEPEFKLGGSGVGGTVELKVYRLDRVALGPLLLEKPYAIIQPPAGIFANPRTPGFIGNYTLDRLGRVIFNYQANRLEFPRVNSGQPSSSAVAHR